MSVQNYSNMAMGVGGFGCSKNALIALNVLYICVAVILIGVAGYGIAASSISSFGVIIAVITIGVFLALIAVVGIVAAAKHHQVMLFFYMVILFVLFIVQFSVACACLSVGDDQIKTLMEHGYRLADNNTKVQVQEHWNCCGFHPHKQLETNDTLSTDPLYVHPTCSSLPCCTRTTDGESCCDPRIDSEKCPCSPCFSKMDAVVKASLRLCGGIGLFFSLTECFGVFLTSRYRNQRNPYINPLDLL